jgi:uncharacterized membrane protein required for colicin V production
MDQTSTANIIDIAIISAALLLGIAGFWRGVAKEVFISSALLLGISLAQQWGDRWGNWVGDQSRLTRDEAVFATSITTVLVVSVILGYVGCMLAGLPPADAPGRVGGFVLGATNAVFAIAVILGWARQHVLNDARLLTLDETRLGSWLSENTDWVLFGATLSALGVVIASWQVRRRRMLIVSAASVRRQPDSGFRFRRDAPLAPEAEKLERPAGMTSAWSVPAAYAETAPLTRVPDPSTRSDRPIPNVGQVESSPALWRTDEVVRCITCGERIGDDDKFCPRCGRQLT